jgi:hypothetical protein
MTLCVSFYKCFEPFGRFLFGIRRLKLSFPNFCYRVAKFFFNISNDHTNIPKYYILRPRKYAQIGIWYCKYMHHPATLKK